MKYHFDQAAADKVFAFFEKFLHHTKGRWYGKPFKLMPWQRDALTQIFGWKRPDGTRRYRQVYIEIPKKNGKTEFSAGIGLFLTLADNEPAAEVYSLAGDREQAAICFDMAKKMVELNPKLAKRCELFRRSIYAAATSSKYEVLSSESSTKHGPSPSGILFDELHVQKNRVLWDTITEGVSARLQPLIISMTTAGWDRTSICWEQHEYAIKVRDGIIKDDEFLPIIYAADEDAARPDKTYELENDAVDEELRLRPRTRTIKAPWKKEATWKKANPAMGVIKSIEFMQKKCQRAQDVPGSLNTFLRLHLNLWTEQSSRWLDIADWDICKNGVSLEKMSNQKCFAGIDLASTRDINAFVMVFPPEDEDGKWVVIPRFYIPEDNVSRRDDESNGNYLTWVSEGYLLTTPGNVTDYDYIRKDIEQLATQIQINEMAFDRWNALQLMTQLQNDGLDVVPFGQGWASMGGPSKEFETLVVSHKIAHDGNPVMKWMVSNAAIKEDPAGNIKPDKSKSSEKIDGVVAAIMALGRATADDGSDNPVEYGEVVMI